MKKILILILLAVLLLAACGQDAENDQEAVYMNITAEEAKQIMDSEEGYIILGVRTQEEYDEGHINGKAIQKICDSFRISDEWKAEFKTLRPELRKRK